jgi:hypothetical protein
MENYICVTCGVQYEASEAPPRHCSICEDEWQYIRHQGALDNNGFVEIKSNLCFSHPMINHRAGKGR